MGPQPIHLVVQEVLGGHISRHCFSGYVIDQAPTEARRDESGATLLFPFLSARHADFGNITRDLPY